MLIGHRRSLPISVEAVKAGQRDTVRSLLKQRADVNVPELDGTTALAWAVRADDLATVEMLIGAGAQVNTKNRYGITPIGLAALNGRAAMVERLLQAGADARTTRPGGETVLMTAARTWWGDSARCCWTEDIVGKVGVRSSESGMNR